MENTPLIQLSTKKKEYRFSTKGPFKGLRVTWQPKQNQIIASTQQTYITVCVKKKRKKNKTLFLKWNNGGPVGHWCVAIIKLWKGIYLKAKTYRFSAITYYFEKRENTRCPFSCPMVPCLSAVAASVPASFENCKIPDKKAHYMSSNSWSMDHVEFQAKEPQQFMANTRTD